MKWRIQSAFIAAVTLVFLQIGAAAVATPPARADELIPTPTPTATPENGQCNEFQCG